MTAGTLYLVATPIGNLEDITVRAARILREVDVIAAEDTRSLRTLLGAVDAMPGAAVSGKRRVVSLFEGNEAERADELVDALRGGASVALVSEAGTPGVSDPGFRVVRAVIAAGFRVEAVPGPVAAVTALVASGLPPQPFLFLGFPPREAGPRRELFGQLRSQPATMVFYEAPDRVAATLADLADAFGEDRLACVARELTKVHEEYRRGALAGLAASCRESPLRGECTLVVAGAVGEAPVVDIEGELRRLLASGLGPKDAAARLVVQTGKPRRQLYQLALSLAREPR